MKRLPNNLSELHLRSLSDIELNYMYQCLGKSGPKLRQSLFKYIFKLFNQQTDLTFSFPDHNKKDADIPQFVYPGKHFEFPISDVVRDTILLRSFVLLLMREFNDQYKASSKLLNESRSNLFKIWAEYFDRLENEFGSYNEIQIYDWSLTSSNFLIVYEHAEMF